MTAIEDHAAVLDQAFVMVPRSFVFPLSASLSITARWIYVVLLSHKAPDTPVIYLSFAKLVDETGFHKGTVVRAVRDLVALNLIEHKEPPSNIRYVIHSGEEKR